MDGGVQEGRGSALRLAIGKRVARWGEPGWNPETFKNQEVSIFPLRPLDGSCCHISPSLVAANPQSLGHQALCVRDALGTSWEDPDSPFICARQAKQRGFLSQELREEPEGPRLLGLLLCPPTPLWQSSGFCAELPL